MTRTRWRRYGLALASASILLQTSTCTLDAETQQTLTTLVVQMLMQTLLSGFTGSTCA